MPPDRSRERQRVEARPINAPGVFSFDNPNLNPMQAAKAAVRAAADKMASFPPLSGKPWEFVGEDHWNANAIREHLVYLWQHKLLG